MVIKIALQYTFPMDFEYEDAEEPYRAIVNQDGGLGMTEILSRPDEYLQALEENDELRPEDLEKDRAAQRAFEVLEEAGLVAKNGDLRTYDVVDYDRDAREEVFGKLYENRELLLN